MSSVLALLRVVFQASVFTHVTIQQLQYLSIVPCFNSVHLYALVVNSLHTHSNVIVYSSGDVCMKAEAYGPCSSSESKGVCVCVCV